MSFPLVVLRHRYGSSRGAPCDRLFPRIPTQGARQTSASGIPSIVGLAALFNLRFPSSHWYPKNKLDRELMSKPRTFWDDRCSDDPYIYSQQLNRFGGGGRRVDSVLRRRTCPRGRRGVQRRLPRPAGERINYRRLLVRGTPENPALRAPTWTPSRRRTECPSDWSLSSPRAGRTVRKKRRTAARRFVRARICSYNRCA